jgi:hypothetical protein
VSSLLTKLVTDDDLQRELMARILRGEKGDPSKHYSYEDLLAHLLTQKNQQKFSGKSSTSYQAGPVHDYSSSCPCSRCTQTTSDVEGGRYDFVTQADKPSTASKSSPCRCNFPQIKSNPYSNSSEFPKMCGKCGTVAACSVVRCRTRKSKFQEIRTHCAIGHS